MDRLSRFLLRHRVAVGLCWLAVLVVGIATAGTVPGRLSTDFSLPGAKSYQANQAILRVYGNGAQARPLVPVVTLPAGTTVDSPGVRQALERTFGAAARDPRLRVVSWASTGDRDFVAADGRTTFGLVYPPPTGPNAPKLGPAVTAAMRGALPPSATLRVTGFDELSAGDGGGGTGVLTETLLGGLGALAVLAFVFGSLLALV
ncbi:MAG TPA: MMPL family transporter, partial [Actinomycetota bacterium]|nr:MMPL family transporter [Actinomycetota bacterium]